MTIVMVRKDGKTFTERPRITLEGNHTMKQKIAMLFDVKFWFEHEHGIRWAGPSDFYPRLIDEHGHPLTHFPDEQLITGFNYVVKHPYPCAADLHHA